MIAPTKRKEYVYIDISLALFLLNILYACGKFAIPPIIPKIVANIAMMVILRSSIQFIKFSYLEIIST